MFKRVVQISLHSKLFTGMFWTYYPLYIKNVKDMHMGLKIGFQVGCRKKTSSLIVPLIVFGPGEVALNVINGS